MTDGDFLQKLFKSVINKKAGLDSFDEAIEIHSVMTRDLILGDITPEVGNTISEFIRLYNLMDAEKPVNERKPIKILVDSNGGDLDATFSIIDAINASTTPVITINVGNAYSGGFLVFICGHYRISFERSRFMFHEGSISLGGDSHKFRNYTDFYEKQLGWMKEIVVSRGNWTDEDYEAKKKDDVWLTSLEAFNMDFVDEIALSFDDLNTLQVPTEDDDESEE